MDGFKARVIELADFVAGPYCGKLLADFGADVIKIERPGRGDDARYIGPFKDDVPNPEVSGTFLYLNTNKRSVELDIETDEGRARFLDLVRGADVLIEDRMPGTLDRLGLGYADLHAVNPNLVVTSITPFGQVGPYRDFKAHHLNLYHASGQGYLLPMWAINLDVPPCQGPGYLGLFDGGMAGATATLAALLWRDGGGTGQHVDVSIQHAMMTLERSQLRRFADDGVDPNRTGKGRLLESLVECAGGEFAVVILSSQQQWEGLWRAMGRPEWGMQPPFDTQKGRSDNYAELRKRLNDWARTVTQDDLFHAIQREGSAAAPILTAEGVFKLEQFRERGHFVTIEHPVAGALEYVAQPARPSNVALAPKRPAPLLGQHTAEVLAELPRDAATPGPLREGSALQGLRVIDFGHVMAGPWCTMQLASLGAEVIKVETRARPDEQRAQHGKGAVDNLEANSNFFEINLGKKSVSLNLSTEEGRDLAKRLVASADLVLENMRPGVMTKLGLDYAELVKVKPDLIMLSLSGFGATGPLRRYAAYNPCFTSVGGVSHLTGHAEKKPNTMTNSGGDARAGTAAVFAALVALKFRQETGRGQYIDSSSCEVINSMIGDQMMDYAMNRRSPRRHGNTDAVMAPHGVYRCAGTDAWLSIAVGSDAEWQGLVRAMGHPDWAADFATAAQRKADEERLDGLIAAWAAEQDAEAAMHRLQAEGVAAMPSFKASQLFTNPHVLERGQVQEVDHPVLGRRKTITAPYRLSATPARIRSTAPRLGEHNAYVFKDLLRMSDDEIARLTEAKVIY
jgi:crotonobetainyl-CoA:carnitine CoA-transferase CaiB-like acyl-CoA transferase